MLNGRGYRCVYVTVETARTARDDVQRAMHTVLATLAHAAGTALGDLFLRDVWYAEVLPRELAWVAQETLGGGRIERAYLSTRWGAGGWTC